MFYCTHLTAVDLNLGSSIPLKLSWHWQRCVALQASLSLLGIYLTQHQPREVLLLPLYLAVTVDVNQVTVHVGVDF